MNNPTFTYIKKFLADKNIGSITPTAKGAVRKICSNINFNKARLIIEYGPGGGVFTQYLLENMRPDAILLAIEANSGFYNMLKDSIHDPRLILCNDGAENVTYILEQNGLGQADYIISGIPFSFFTPDFKNHILCSTANALSPSGMFLVYQFLPRPILPEKRLTPFLAEHFSELDKGFAILNVPPLRVYKASSPRQTANIHNTVYRQAKQNL